MAVTGHLASAGTLCPVMGEILYTKFEILIPLLGLGFRVHCAACELSSLASVICLSLFFCFFFPGSLDSSSKQKKRKEKKIASVAVKEVVVWIVDIRTVATMAGGDTDMRSWADLLHNSSQLLHSYSPSAPLPPIQVPFKIIILRRSNCKSRENSMR